MRLQLRLLILAVGLVTSTLPVAGLAQGGAQSESSEESESSEAESAETSEGADASKGDEESGAPESESSETSGVQRASGDDGAADGESEGATESGEGAGETPETGPGGQKLRQEYPGTEESKQGQMESDRIEGLQFEEGQEPGRAYDVKIKELETRIDDLKEKVFQSKSRVVLLKETVLGGNLSGSRAMIVHTNELGGQFKLRRAMYSLDGNRVFNESKKTGKLKGNEFKVYDGSISAGNHNVSVLLEYKGSGYGVFNYMKGYEMKITSSCQFEAEAGKATILRVSATKKGGALRDSMKSADVKCEIETTDVSQDQLQENSGDGGGSPTPSESGGDGGAESESESSGAPAEGSS